MPMQAPRFVQARNFTPGRPGKIELLVLHSMESSEKPQTAENVAAWFAGPNAPRASAHYCVDQDSIVQCVRDEDQAWHAPGANSRGIGIEMAGRAAQTAAEWDDLPSRAMLAHVEQLLIHLCIRYQIPARVLGPQSLLRGFSGITTHDFVSKAWRKSTHWDPGPHFPLFALVARVAVWTP